MVRKQTSTIRGPRFKSQLPYFLVVIFQSSREEVLEKIRQLWFSKVAKPLFLTKIYFDFLWPVRQSLSYTEPDPCPAIPSGLRSISVVHRQGSFPAPQIRWSLLKINPRALTFRNQAVVLKVWSWDLKHQNHQPYKRPDELEMWSKDQQSVC